MSTDTQSSETIESNSWSTFKVCLCLRIFDTYLWNSFHLFDYDHYRFIFACTQQILYYYLAQVCCTLCLKRRFDCSFSGHFCYFRYFLVYFDVLLVIFKCIFIGFFTIFWYSEKWAIVIIDIICPIWRVSNFACQPCDTT